MVPGQRRTGTPLAVRMSRLPARPWAMQCERTVRIDSSVVAPKELTATGSIYKATAAQPPIKSHRESRDARGPKPAGRSCERCGAGSLAWLRY